MNYRKKLIEVALPLEAINVASAKEKSIRHGHPSTLHLWWARRPLAACRAVLFGQLVDDPSSWPDRFPTDEAQDRERQRLFRLIESLVIWENSNNEGVIHAARVEIAQSFARGRVADGLADERDQQVLANLPPEQRSTGLYDQPDKARSKLIDSYLAEVAPPVHDPFAGGGSIPLEAQRLGLRAIATDLNPVAVLINKALIEIPPKFAGMAAVNPESRKQQRKDWKGAQGLAEDVRYYGKWMRDEAFKRIGHLYPEVELPKEQGGGKATVIAWLWARTVASPNPAFGGVHVPLLQSYWLSRRPGRLAWVEPVVDRIACSWTFRVCEGKPDETKILDAGTKIGRGTFACLLSGDPVSASYIQAEGKAGRLGVRLVAIIGEGNRQRIYASPTPEHEGVLRHAIPEWTPDYEFAKNSRHMTPWAYGLDTFAKLFTPRQLVALTEFCNLVKVVRDCVLADASSAGLPDGGGLEDGGTDAIAYADAVAVYIAQSVSKSADLASALCHWQSNPEHLKIAPTFSRHALSFSPDFAEGNPFSASSGNFFRQIELIAECVETLGLGVVGVVAQNDATISFGSQGRVISSDPPYYDNVPYADLSDFFYVWLRRALQPVLPQLFRTMLVPKASELVAETFRHGSREQAEAFFMAGMTQAITAMTQVQLDSIPAAIYYAFKQAESSGNSTASTGWETFLQAVLKSGFFIDGTWPVRTERPGRLRDTGSNALASSIVLVCRKRPADAPTITRTDFRRQLRQELPAALKALQHGNIAPVDMAQASIGPGMAIFSRHSKVLEADGSAMSVRTALQIINQALDEYLTEQEGEFDPDTRFAVTWFETRCFDSGAFGEAETLAKARNVSVQGVADAGLLQAGAGKVRLLRREELPDDYSPLKDKTPTVWEAVQHLIKRLDQKGEQGAADLLSELGGRAAAARDLAYRLYQVCERKGWAEEARAYNGLVVAWGEVDKLAGQVKPERRGPVQGSLL